jgi:hypothetical protein
LPGTYDFSATASAAAVANRPYRTVATGVFNNTTNPTLGCTISATNTCVPTALSIASLAPYVDATNTVNYGSGFAFNAVTGATTVAAGTTLVNSPITTVCFACHDSEVAPAAGRLAPAPHMRDNHGSIYAPRAAALANPEQCLLCHGPGQLADIKVMHNK